MGAKKAGYRHSKSKKRFKSISAAVKDLTRGIRFGEYGIAGGVFKIGKQKAVKICGLHRQKSGKSHRHKVRCVTMKKSRRKRGKR